MDLKEILAIQTSSKKCWRMFAYIIRKANEFGWQYKTDKLGNIYITKGESDLYPCMVAHMDTVHKMRDGLIILEYFSCLTGFDPFTMEQAGIGGDDKVGVWVALSFLERATHGKIAFFVDEEIGCVGSKAADMTFFQDCSLVLQCDRKGNSDFITKASGVELSSQEFQFAITEIISKHGYKFGDGLVTDVKALKENGLDCCAANISCGYFRPHTSSEYVDLYDAHKCRDMCFEIMDAIGDVKWAHKAPPKPVYPTYGNGYSGFGYGQGGGYYGNGNANKGNGAAYTPPAPVVSKRKKKKGHKPLAVIPNNTPPIQFDDWGFPVESLEEKKSRYTPAAMPQGSKFYDVCDCCGKYKYVSESQDFLGTYCDDCFREYIY